MERSLNLKLETETIYEIYRGCRLCGDGAGYKMPIVQNVINLEENGVNLSKKILECLQIEVHQDDKMPPLICELCVDKVNDFYEYLELTRQTNIQTRSKLGLPLETLKQGNVSDSSDCILGVTEPIYVDDDSDTEPLVKHVNKPSLRERLKEKDKDKDKQNDKVKNKEKDRQSDKLIKNMEKERQKDKEKEREKDKEKDRQKDKEKEKSNKEKDRQRDKEKDSQKDKEKERQRDKEKEKPKYKEKDRQKDKEKEDGLKAEITSKNRKEIKIVIKNLKKELEPAVRLRRPAINSMQNKDKDKQSSILQDTVNKLRSAVKQPKSILKKGSSKDTIKIEDVTPLTELKRTRSSEDKQPVSAKRVRLSMESTKLPPTPAMNRPIIKPSKEKRKPSPSPASRPEKAPSPDLHMCPVCFQENRTSTGYYNHMRTHVVNYTNNKLVCNPCGEWFLTVEETTAHHKKHKYKGVPYKCRICHGKYANMELFNKHFALQCVQSVPVPDMRCEVCWREFATENLLIQHKCLGLTGRPGGKCEKCNRTFVLLKNLKSHGKYCKAKKNCGLKVEPGVMEKLIPVQIRIARCDALLSNSQHQWCDVSNLADDYGLDKSCVYPYISSVRSLRVKNEPFDGDVDGMVNLHEDIKNEICEYENLIDWDSDNDDDDDATDTGVCKIKKIDTLASLALKAMCSQRCLGKVPKKYRKIKVGRMFDSLGEFGVKNVDKLLEKLDDADVSDGKVRGEMKDTDIGFDLTDKSSMLREDTNHIDATTREAVNSGNSNIDENSSNNTADVTLDVNMNNEELNNGSKQSQDIEPDIIRNGSTDHDNCVTMEKTQENSNDFKDSCDDSNENSTDEGNVDSKEDNVETVDVNGGVNLEKGIDYHSGILKESSAANNVSNIDFDNNGFMEFNEHFSAEVEKAIPNKLFDQTDLFIPNIGNGKIVYDSNDICETDEKMILDDLFDNKERDGKLDLDTVSEEFNFDV